MSIIVRLQNLPLSAKSGDIRRFFGGLRIPEGGVHIFGGEKGDAFIVFCSDEDGRLALRKDGGKIKDSRVKLFLSSRMEMQYEVEKMAKHNLLDASHGQEKEMENDTSWHRSPERAKRFSRSQSPPYNEHADDGFRDNISHHQRSKDSVERTMHEMRSSPRRSRSPHRSFSPKSRTFSHRKRSMSPEVRNYMHNPEQLAMSQDRYEEFHNFPASKQEIQAQLERRITEVIEANARSKFGNEFCALDEMERTLSPRIGEYYTRHSTNMQDDMHLSPFMPIMHGDEGIGSQAYISGMPKLCCEMDRPGEFYLMMSGLNKRCNFKDVQMILKGIFAPLSHIKWEYDDRGIKTGTAFIKLTNKDDFKNVLNNATFMFNDHRITVSECPKFISHSNFHIRDRFSNAEMPRFNDLCYALKGLPFSCTYEDIVDFFHGFDIKDIVIFYDESGRASGRGFVCFNNWIDFENAESQNGKKIGHRYIEMTRCSDSDFADGKKKMNPDTPSYASYLKQTQKRLFGCTRTLCAIVTGLPSRVYPKKVTAFFSNSGAKPDAVHLIMNNKRVCDGRAFVEFANLHDFDEGLKLHGKNFDGNIICVRQILFDEMNNILASQKVKHHYSTESSPPPSSLNIPEKVPYLWEPPDVEPKKRDRFEHSGKKGGNRVDPVSSFRNESFLNESRHPINLNPFPDVMNYNYMPNTAMPVQKHFDSHFKQEKLNREMENFIVENELNVFFRKAVFSEDSKDPVKSNSSKRYPPKTDEAHSQTKNADKSTKLSPERKYPQTMKDGEEGNYASRSKNDSYSRNRSKKEFEQDSKRKSELHYKNAKTPVTSHSEGTQRSQEDLKGAIVQISNVSNSVKTEDLLHFLKGFNFYGDTLIRRYTDDGEPTSDIRVTFSSCREAGRAIRALNKSTLNGREIIMFLA